MGNKQHRDDLPVEVVHVDLADQNSIAALVAASFFFFMFGFRL